MQVIECGLCDPTDQPTYMRQRGHQHEIVITVDFPNFQTIDMCCTIWHVTLEVLHRQAV